MRLKASLRLYCCGVVGAVGVVGVVAVVPVGVVGAPTGVVVLLAGWPMAPVLPPRHLLLIIERTVEELPLVVVILFLVDQNRLLRTLG